VEGHVPPELIEVDEEEPLQANATGQDVFPPADLNRLWVVGYEPGVGFVHLADAPIQLGRFGGTRLSLDKRSPYDPGAYDAIAAAVQAVPEIGSWVLDFDNSIPATVQAYLDAGRPSEAGELPPVLFHGTSSEAADRILEDGYGLVPRGETGVEAAYGAAMSAGAGSPDVVHLASGYALGPARFAARDAARVHGGHPVILEVDASALDERRLRPDDDSDAADWIESMKTMGTLAYAGIIPASALRVGFELGASGEWVAS
jgi:hypothetical protein